MQTAGELIASLFRRGVRLWSENGELRFQAPKGELSFVELESLRAQKAEVIEFLEQTQSAAEVALEPRAAGCVVPLTPLQASAWDWYGLGHKSVRTCTTAWRILGPLNTRLLQNAVATIVRRHESLRTRIACSDGVPRQLIDPACDWELDLIDLNTISSTSVEEEAKRITEELALEKFDLSVGPLFAPKLLRLSNRDHVLILALDHMVSDDASVDILINEVWTLYDQGVRGLHFSLPELPVQFADYAVWQQQNQKAWLRNHGPYWRGRLLGAPRAQLRPEHAAPTAERVTGVAVDIPFGSSLSARIGEIARNNQTQPALAVFVIYLSLMVHWCNQQDVVMPFCISGRYRPELENMIGFLADFLHLRIEVTVQDTFLDVLNKAKFEFHSAYEHLEFGLVPKLMPEWAWTSDRIEDLAFFWAPSSSTQHLLEREVDPHRQLKVKLFKFDAAIPLNFLPYFYKSEVGIVCFVRYLPEFISENTVSRFGRNLLRFAEEFGSRPLTRVMSMSIEME